MYYLYLFLNNLYNNENLFLLLTLSLITLSSYSQDIHSFYYLDVPRSKASKFVKMHKNLLIYIF